MEKIIEEEGLSSLSSGSEEGRKRSYEEIKRKRKKYVLTKRREYWTKEEHARFVRALSVHGKEWKLIEQEVGTKTAVQIRSHAQKHFLRMERARNSNPRNGSAVSSGTSSPVSSVETCRIEDIAQALLSMKNAGPSLHTSAMEETEPQAMTQYDTL